MKMNSKLFDKIRIRPDAAEQARAEFPPCEWEGCDLAGEHKAPKGRGQEGKYHRFCIDHVRLYNKSYNYFAGMGDDAIQAYQRDALTGHRPTWTMGVNRWGQAADGTRDATVSPDATVHDPFGMFHGSRPAGSHARVETPKRRVSSATQKAFDTLGVDIDADKADIKAQFKVLVKRHHPDANGGDRTSEERLRQIIQAYNYLKAAGFC
ncbi:J domain-containing protein [Chthonobacter rhizosphaerae]|uniref:J domain-containing protein n=1 Tax=Chthonobacter rhizosphaerae TaxID=2735553 RepID=UPI0015EF60EC|nr:J domain-containing protein [Chthonobacter rhizosphaerae]